ncbi:restriction endonuclease [Candidatus Bipolaricaulota bacterium]
MKRLKRELPDLLPDNKMIFVWEEAEYEYVFKTLGGTSGWGNPDLGIDGKGVQSDSEDLPLTDAMADVLMLVFHGGTSLNPEMPEVVLERCILGSLLGRKDELDHYVRQRYIWVSRIVQGAQANALGQLAQHYVKQHLQNRLPGWDCGGTTIPGISHNDGRTSMSFDIVVQSPSSKYTAIEVSFQVTTNSTIERKAGQAEARHRHLADNGHRIAYVLDGAGNFERSSALTTILENCDIAVTFRDDELDKLAKFLLDQEGTN